MKMGAENSVDNRKRDKMVKEELRAGRELQKKKRKEEGKENVSFMCLTLHCMPSGKHPTVLLITGMGEEVDGVMMLLVRLKPTCCCYCWTCKYINRADVFNICMVTRQFSPLNFKYW